MGACGHSERGHLPSRSLSRPFIKGAGRDQQRIDPHVLELEYPVLARQRVEADDAATAADVVGEGLSAMLSGRPGPVLFSLPLRDNLCAARPDASRARSDACLSISTAAGCCVVVSVVVSMLSAAVSTPLEPGSLEFTAAAPA